MSDPRTLLDRADMSRFQWGIVATMELVGMAIGSLILGLLTGRVRLLGLTIAAMLLSTALVIVFGRTQSDLATLSVVAAAAGFATNAGVVGLYALIARSFVIGVGRGGSALDRRWPGCCSASAMACNSSRC
ncbi:hypothetical protein [Sphingomonas sp. SAFR-052]|uniref:hypothetical protein n=1 Tax=Sphingomonas sp. SAFR-052 TaxID=3436867 RepID=UPI003F7E01E0